MSLQINLGFITFNRKVAATNLMPTGVPSQGREKRRKFIQMKSLQIRERRTLVETKVLSTEPKGRPKHIEKVPALVPHWSMFMQIRNSDLHTLIGSKGTVLNGQTHESKLAIMKPL